MLYGLCRIVLYSYVTEQETARKLQVTTRQQVAAI
jgi:hypothetical protein